MGSRNIWLAAVVIGPCAVLAFLLFRFLDQERALAERRAAEAAERRIVDARQALLAQLEPVRLGAAPAAFQGVIRNGRVVHSWEGRANQAALTRLERAVQSKDAAELRALASLDASVTDEHGVPIAVYALPHGNEHRRKALLASIESAPHLLSPMGLKLVGARPELVAHAEAARAKFDVVPSAGQWIAWGDPLYLVGFAPSAGDLAFRGVRAPSNASIDRGVPLGGPFVNVRVSLPPVPATESGGNRPILLAMFATAIGVALIGGFLLWRDGRREKEVAALRTQFIAAVSHELRTPLTALRIFIESMKMNPDLDLATREEYLDTMQHETERLSRLVNNVLEFSRIERRQKTYTLLPVSLDDLIESVIASVRPMMEQAGFRLDVNVAALPGDVPADRDALEQALLNLLTNAMKYSGSAREIRVRVGMRGEYASIEVQDFGVGIDDREKARIFESFYRVPSDENRNIQGAGLGLTLVHHVMAGHGGDVTVESERGKGSTFRLLLPV